jgi:hypothetical protein
LTRRTGRRQCDPPGLFLPIVDVAQRALELPRQIAYALVGMFDVLGVRTDAKFS